ncbi:MAG: 2Fe-2S iron-sulfur cluster-binding protein [Myxococcota bacterium]
MKAVQFAQTARVVEVKTHDQLLQALLSEQVPVKMACGGRGLCATCHVYIEHGNDALTPRTKREVRTLDLIGSSCGSSRLACQAKVVNDGVIVKLPEGLYVERTADLESLIGRRTEQRLLHPVNGQELLAPGKIMTRSVLRQLQHVEVDVQKVLNDSRTA